MLADDIEHTSFTSWWHQPSLTDSLITPVSRPSILAVFETDSTDWVACTGASVTTALSTVDTVMASITCLRCRNSDARLRNLASYSLTIYSYNPARDDLTWGTDCDLRIPAAYRVRRYTLYLIAHACRHAKMLISSLPSMPWIQREDKAHWSLLSLTHLALRWFPAGLTHVATIVTDTHIGEAVTAVCVCIEQKQRHLIAVGIFWCWKEQRAWYSSLAWSVGIQVSCLPSGLPLTITSHRERW